MKKLFSVFFIGAVLILFTAPFLFSQTNFIISREVPPASLYITKNISYSDSTKKDTLKSQKKIETFRMKKNPWIAVLLSAAIPGAGQFYNQSYWKVPVLIGLTAYFGYEYYDQDKQFRNYRDQYSASQNQQFPDGDPNLKTLREFYRSQRDEFTWYFMITYFVNLVDAYVDAHLFDFDVKDENINRFGVVDRTYNLRFHINF